MNFKGSDRNSKAGFWLSLPVWAIFSLLFLAEAVDVQDVDSFWYAVPYLAPIPAAFSLLIFAPPAFISSAIGIRKQRTPFAWVALFFSIAPIALLIIEIVVILIS